MATDESHDEALPKTARTGADADAADTGWISPLYHGNEAETDLKPVGDVDEMLILADIYSVPANLHSRERCRCKYRIAKSLD